MKQIKLIQKSISDYGHTIPIIKRNEDVMALYIYRNSNNSFLSSPFPTGLRFVKARQVL